MERLINKKLINYLESNSILPQNQFGFRKRKSTSFAALELDSGIVERLNQHKKVLTAFLDLAKAFGTVPLTCFISKRENMGVRDIQLQLFKSDLTGRSQRVQIDKYLNDELPIS